VTRGASILTLERGVPTVLPIPAPIPKVGIGAGIGKAPFSLISRGRRAAHASRPPTLRKLLMGGREVKRPRLIREKGLLESDGVCCVSAATVTW